jgi:hypothetical protein
MTGDELREEMGIEFDNFILSFQKAPHCSAL